MDYFQWLFVSWRGRINRKLYFLSIMVLCLISLIPKMFSVLLSFQLWDYWFNFYFSCMAGPLLSLGAKRLHDTGHNLLWIIKLLPVVGVLISILVELNVFGEKFARIWHESGDETIAVQVVYSLLFFIPAFKFVIVLFCIPGPRDDNRYGPDPIVEDQKHPALEKISSATEMIEPWVDKNFPFALSLQAQLDWCQLILSGYGQEEPAGELTMVLQAEKAFDEWNQKAHLIKLLSDIEHAMRGHTAST